MGAWREQGGSTAREPESESGVKEAVAGGPGTSLMHLGVAGAQAQRGWFLVCGMNESLLSLIPSERGLFEVHVLQSMLGALLRQGSPLPRSRFSTSSVCTLYSEGRLPSDWGLGVEGKEGTRRLRRVLVEGVTGKGLERGLLEGHRGGGMLWRRAATIRQGAT